VSFPQPVDDGQGDKLRGKPEKFADHYTQATLFYESQTAVEQAHIVGGFRFELSKVTVPAIRERMLSSLVNVSPALSLTALPGDGGVRSRSVAILVADGVDAKSLAVMTAALQGAGATAHLIAPRLGPVKGLNGDALR
jgi:catalase